MEKYLPYITTLIAIGGFVFSVFKFVDLKQREEKRLNYENLNKLISNISGKIYNTGKVEVIISEQIASIYQLLEFKKYSSIILPFLNYIKDCPINTDPKSLEHINEAIEYVESKLNSHAGQIATSGLCPSSQ
ncbi:MAG: hypothetical protein A2Y25_08630 [Candidatus Melainabacteria bacterium GWF2_37_15]|nr:MAG: hypothetical protein A2Y25_08630 [Candidatus Melainabacteria bacterium GWF2_37_15]